MTAKEKGNLNFLLPSLLLLCFLQVTNCWSCCFCDSALLCSFLSRLSLLLPLLINFDSLSTLQEILHPLDNPKCIYNLFAFHLFYFPVFRSFTLIPIPIPIAIALRLLGDLIFAVLCFALLCFQLLSFSLELGIKGSHWMPQQMSVSNCCQQICCHWRNCYNYATTGRQSETADDSQQRHTNTKNKTQFENTRYHGMESTAIVKSI